MHFCAGTSIMIALHGVSILSCTFERPAYSFIRLDIPADDFSPLRT